ncbi:MAG: YwiC-like family protein [Opitutaceae bacterium]|nr:YwiC-like family protein [Opitutaceae bacterium]
MNDRSTGPRELLLPKEHGSWSLAFEPVALGLLVAPSWAGAALALAAAAGFFLRRPLKLAVTLPDDDPRRAAARPWVAILLLAALTGLAGAARLGAFTALWPLLLAAPCGLFFVWFDLRQGMREAEAELAGSAAFAVLTAAFATLASWPAPAALALAAVMLARSVPTVVTVRTYLRLGKGRPASVAPALASAGLALALIAALAHRELVPAAAVIVAVALTVRTAWLVTGLRPAWPAKRVGILEAVLGVAMLATLAAAY